jgi:tetratricopeptide (TPR) repeat protein
MGSRRAAPGAGEPDAERRPAEAQRMAKALFERARYEESIDEIYNAVQLAEQAARTDPRAEYWSTLGRLQARNKAWRTRAIESYKNALELDPQDGDVRFALGRLYEQTGDAERARAQYQAAASTRPPHAEARAALDRLGGAARGGSGAFGRLFRRE